MKAIITNQFTIIKNPTNDIVREFKQSMSYTDKQKQFELRRLEKNPFYKNKSYIDKLKKEINCCILKNLDGGHIAFNSGLSFYLNNINIEDKRTDTGKVIALPWVKKPFNLRPYQEEAVQVAVENWRGIIAMATGLGKTLVATYLIKKLKRNTLIMVPSESIAKQFYKELVDAFGESMVGYYGGGKKKIKSITVGIVASVVNAIDEFKKADLGVIIVDEVHHLAASTFYEITTALGDVGRIYGLTATDYRSDGKDLLIHAGCGQVIIKRDIKWGIDNNFLAKPKFIVKKVSTIGVDHKYDKLKNYKEHILNNSLMKDEIKNDIKKYIALGKSVLCLVGEIEHGVELSKELGVPFAQGKDKKSQGYVDDLNSGKISCLIGTNGKISEGTDTRNVDVLVLASFMASKGPVIQSIGRALRRQGSKIEALIIDYMPSGSTMLTRHAQSRIAFYKEITIDVQVL